MFHSARLKLTTWYLTIIMAVSVAFSVVIYRGLSQEVDRFARSQRFFIERRLGNGGFVFPSDMAMLDPELVDETKHRIITFLSAINVGIFVLAGGLGYFLAGRTLRPIADMVDEQHRFVSDASHELKTPLTSLKSAFEVYLRDRKRTKTDADTLVRESIAEVNKLQSLSESLLSLAQYQSNGTQLKEKIALSDIIGDAVRKINPMAIQKNIRIENMCSDATLYGTKHGLTELFVILLDNAVKYSDEKTTVKLTNKISDRWITVHVADHGIGIQKKNLSHIFDRFFQEDGARSKSRGGGYGLGLSIAKKIVETHGGTITATNTPKGGTTFSIALPTFSSVSAGRI